MISQPLVSIIFMCVMIFSRSADLDGRNRHLVSSAVINPVGLTLFEEYIYWTDFRTSQVERVNRFTGQDHSVLFSDPDYRGLYSINVNHPSKQPDGEYLRISHGNRVICGHILLNSVFVKLDVHVQFCI